jgi:hypothetical protein
MKNKWVIKGLLLLTLIFGSLSARAIEPCITNLVIFVPGDCLFNVITAPQSGWTRVGNTVTGTCMLADSCTNGPLFAVSLPPSSACATNYEATVGQISWSCSQACGGGTHSFLLRLPVGVSAMKFRVYLDPVTPCQVDICMFDFMFCSMVGEPPPAQ